MRLHGFAVFSVLFFLCVLGCSKKTDETISTSIEQYLNSEQTESVIRHYPAQVPDPERTPSNPNYQKERISANRKGPYLSCRSQQIEDLDDYLKFYTDAELEPVTQMFASFNQIREINTAIKRFPNLQELDLSDNKIESVDISRLPQTLQALFLAKNNLSSLDMEQLPPSLKALVIDENPIQGTFRFTKNLNNLNWLVAGSTEINNILVDENYDGVPISLELGTLENPEEFLKLSNVKHLSCSVSKDYAGNEIDIARKIRENNPGADVIILRELEER